VQVKTATDVHYLDSTSLHCFTLSSLQNDMLKRQRPASPPPSMPAIPFADDPPFEVARHQSKRRRVLPPVLDGQARGWGELGHEDWDGEDDEEYEHHIMYSTDQAGALADSSRYKSANGVLHDLHTLHRRRLLSSSSPNPQLSRSSPASPSFQAHDKTATLALLRPSGLSPELDSPADATPADESLRVSERYEDTNRFGSSV
jgi:hypothetical protein